MASTIHEQAIPAQEKGLTFAESEAILQSLILETVEGIESGEIAPTDEDISNAVEAMLRGAAEKRDKMASVYFWFETIIGGCKEQEKAMEARRKRFEKKRDNLLGYIDSVMQMMGAERLEGITSVLSRRKLPPSVEVFDTEKIPEAYVNTVVTMSGEDVPATIIEAAKSKVDIERKPDKRMILDALKNNQQVDGCRLIRDARKLEIKR